jgi:hypothetical protein
MTRRKRLLIDIVVDREWKSSLSVDSLCYRRWSAIVSFFLSILRDEIDFFHCLDFVSIIWLVWNSASNRFLCDFFLRFLSFSFSCFSFIDCRFDHCEIIISHYLFSLTITMRWSWNDRRRKRESCWKEEKKHRLSCAVSCVSLWIEREWESQKFWELWSNFDLRKKKLDVVFNDSKFDLFALMNVICFIDLF